MEMVARVELEYWGALESRVSQNKSFEVQMRA
jgi:hypothetical protein